VLSGQCRWEARFVRPLAVSAKDPVALLDFTPHQRLRKRRRLGLALMLYCADSVAASSQ
jgi:hypothetical protein